MTNLFNDWYRVSRRDPRVADLYSRHYSSKKNGKKIRHWLDYGITAPGEEITLLRSDCSALFVWSKQQYRKDGQTGASCAVFRNEGTELSSELILQAEEWAWKEWKGERLFTFVDGDKTKKRRGKSNPPGYCFIKAGWKECGASKDGLIILEKFPMEITR
jgi:hypothetical protein